MPDRRSILRGLLVSALAPAAAHAQRRSTAGPLVAAAADLRFAMDELVRVFRRETGMAIRPVYGSSGQVFQQIMAGAPFELFFSADEDFVFRLADAGRTVDRGALYAIGRIVLVAPPGSDLPLDPEMRGLGERLRAGRVRRLAIANPEHAPYGLRAEEALRAAGLWEAIRPALVFGENVAQALQFALAGGASGGIVALSLVLAPTFPRAARHVPIPATMHQPLRQRMVLLKGAGEAARAFHAWLRGPGARAILARYGFILPDRG